jgi:hypothetical protein
MKKELAREITREINYELIVNIEYVGNEVGADAGETIYVFDIVRTYAEGIFDPYEDEVHVYVNQHNEIVDMDGTEGEEEENAIKEMMKEILSSTEEL